MGNAFVLGGLTYLYNSDSNLFFISLAIFVGLLLIIGIAFFAYYRHIQRSRRKAFQRKAFQRNKILLQNQINYGT